MTRFEEKSSQQNCLKLHIVRLILVLVHEERERQTGSQLSVETIPPPVASTNKASKCVVSVLAININGFLYVRLQAANVTP